MVDQVVWVFVFSGIALLGLAMLIGYAVWLAHKTADVFSELSMLGDRAGELLALAAQVGVPEPAGRPIRYDDDLSVSGDVSE
jgi:hypothetical protein